jgi:hypothetical protein
MMAKPLFPAPSGDWLEWIREDFDAHGKMVP